MRDRPLALRLGHSVRVFSYKSAFIDPTFRETQMSKRSYLRKGAVSLVATLGMGALGTDASAQIVMPPDLTIGTVNTTPGLLEGRVAGAFNITAPNPGDRGNKLEPILAQTAGGNNVEPWPDNITYIYTGQMFFPDNGTAADGISEFAFAEHVDDSTQIKINGIERLNNTVWNAVNTTGRLELSAGWHNVEFRFGQGGGGAGPSTDTNADADANNPWTNALGFGVDFVSPIEADLRQPSYQRPVDDGSGSLFRVATFNTDNARDGQSVMVNANAKLTVNQDRTVPLGALTIADGVTFTVDATSSTTTFSGTTVGATAGFNITTGTVNTGPITSAGGTINKLGFSTLQVAPGTTVNPATTFNVSQGTLEVTNNNAVTSLNGAPITLSGGRLFTNASVQSVVQSHVGDVGFDGTFVEDVLEPGTTPGSNYLVFQDITAANFVLSSTPLVGGTARAPVNAIELRNGTTSLAINFTDPLNTTAPSDVTGPAGVSNTVTWNNVSGTNGSATGLNADVSGASNPTTASIGWTSAGTWSSTGRGEENNTAPAGENRELMTGYLDTGGLGGVGVRIDVADLPASLTSGTGYDLYVYIKGGVNGRGGDYTLLNNAPITFGSDVSVTENSSIGSNGGPPLLYGDLSITAGKTLTVESSNYRFADVNLSSGTTTLSINAGVVTALGRFTDGANTGVTLIKAGPGTLNLTSGTNDLDGTTIDVPAGTLQATAPTSGANPLSGAAVRLSGGTLALDPSAFGMAVFNNNVTVTANSTLNVTGSAGEATIGNVAVNSGLTLTKSGTLLLRTGDVTINGNTTLNATGNMSVASINDGTNTGTLTKAGGGTLTVVGAGDLGGTSVVINGGALSAAGAGSLANTPAINVTNGAALRVGHADALPAATPITIDRGSFVDFDVAMTSSRKITVPAFAAIVGQLDNLSYGTGANQIGLDNNSVLAPDAGETNLPAPGPAGNRLLLGVTSITGTYTHGTETSTGPTDLYRGVAIGGWTEPGALATTLNGPAGGELNVYIAAPPGLQPGNLTFKNINPTATQFNSSNNVVSMIGQGRVIINGGGGIGGSWTILNRTGDPNFFGANNVVLELAGSAVPNLPAGKTAMIRHGSLNLPGGGGANRAVVGGTVNIREGGALILDDANLNAPSSGIFNITGTAGTTMLDQFGGIIDINGDGVGNASDVSTGPGAMYINQNNGNVLQGGATFNVGEGFLLIHDADDITDEFGIITVMPKADQILDDVDRDNTNVTAGTTSNPFILGNGRRLTTTSNNNADINDDGTHTAVNARLIADPAIVGMPNARVILSAAEGRALDINDRDSQFGGVTLQIGDPNPFTTTEGSGGQSQAFDQLRVQRRTVAQTGRVRLAGVTAGNIVIESGRVDFEDNFAVTLGATGHFNVNAGTMYVNNDAVLMAALEAGNLGRAGAEIRLGDGGALYTEFDRGVVRTVSQAVRTTGAGKSYLVLDEGGGNNLADVHYNNVTLAPNSTLDMGLNGGNALLRATINSADGSAIENNASDTNIHVNVNAGANPITFVGSRLTQLDSTVTASQIKIGDGTTRSGRLSIANQTHVGATPIVLSPFSHFAYNPGTGNTVTPNLAAITQGSGTLRAQSGTVDFGTGIVTGAVATSTPVAGLHHSVLPGSANLTEPNANTDVQLGTLAATTPQLEGTFGKNSAFGQVNSTHVYSGEFFDADGIVAFAEHFDDTVMLVVNGRTLLNNGAFNVPTTSPDDDAATPGLQTNIGTGNAGWHTFEVRLGQGTGGVGAPGNQGGANWPFGTFGFGFNPNPGTSITNAIQQSNYQPMLDNGSMNLFRTSADPGAGDLFVDGGAVMSMGGFASQTSLTLNGAAAATANLKIVGTTGTNTLARTTVNGLGSVDNAAGSTVQLGALTMANSATLTKLGAGTMEIGGAASIGTGTTLAATAGTTNIGASLRLGTLSVGDGATARITAGGVKNVVANTLTIAGGPTPTGTLDVTNNGVVVDYPAAGPVPVDIRAQIISGRGAPGLIGTWDGKGITSSTSAAAPDSTSVGYAVNGDMPLGPVTTFRGETVDASSILIRHTRIGDANLDGVVNDDDVTIVGAVYAPGVPNASWANGDFDYNGFVDDDDVTLLGALYNPGLPPLPAPGAEGGVAAVPEPSTWLMLTLGGLGAGLFGWRRRKASKSH
jgi:hypothetical protein